MSFGLAGRGFRGCPSCCDDCACGADDVAGPKSLCRNAVYCRLADDASEITVLQLPKFKAEATELIGTGGIDAVAVYLIGHANAGDVIPGAGGARKMRWAAHGKGKRGGARIIYLYLAIIARIYLLSCYAKNVKTDLTADEKKELRRIAAHLKGVQ